MTHPPLPYPNDGVVIILRMAGVHKGLSAVRLHTLPGGLRWLGPIIWYSQLSGGYDLNYAWGVGRL